MARDKGHLTDLQLRHWIKAGQPLAKADGDGWLARQRLAWRVDRAIDVDAWRTATGPAPLH
jgi:hypothetical protein